MKVVDLPIEQLQEAYWNPNRMDEATAMKLRESLSRYGLVNPLVVRSIGESCFEVLSGNQRLQVLKEMGFDKAACVVLDLGGGQARLLAQVLNHLHGEDDIGLRAELLRKVLEVIPEEEALVVLPETAQSLKALASMGQETIAAYLQNWQQAQAARLRHLQFQLTPAQLEVVEKALARLLPAAKREKGDSPNARGTALYLMCKDYLEDHRV